MPQTVLVTGGAGYIGSVVVSHLLAHGYQVRVLDSLLFGSSGVVGFLGHPSYELVRGDIRKQTDVDRALDSANHVVHLAAIVGEPACNRDPLLTRAVNGAGSSLLLERAKHHGIQRFVFASTCSNYGQRDEKDAWADESSPLEPISIYAATKVGFEYELLALPAGPLTTVILRFATVYGLSFRPRFDLTINEFAATLAAGETLEVYGADFWRPYCHVHDIASSVLLALETSSDKVHATPFNIGTTSENFTKRMLISLLTNEIPEVESRVSIVERGGDKRNYRVNCDRAGAVLGFTAQKNVRDGIREVASAFRHGLFPDFHLAQYRNA